MPAPDALRPKKTESPAEFLRCRYPDCGREFSRRRGGNKFCSNTCRWAADADARQVLHRLPLRKSFHGASLNDLIALTLSLESRLTTPSEQQQSAWTELSGLNHLLATKGPHDPATRADVIRRANAVRLQLEWDRPKDLQGSCQYIRALEILRDAGVERKEDIPRLLRYGWEAAHFYRRIKDFPRLARALQALANTCRLNEDDSTARELTLSAYHILRQKCDQADVNVSRLLHQSTFWNLRLSAKYTDRRQGPKDYRFRRMIELAERIDTPAIWLETQRELAGYFGMWRDFDRATEHIFELHKVLKVNPDLATDGAPTFWRPTIELLLEMGKPDAEDHAINLIRTTYVDLYRKDLNLYYWTVLASWAKRLRIAIEAPPPAYASPILMYLPRDEGD